MGTQKLLLPYAGQSVIGHIADQLLASKVGRVFVVVGSDAQGVGSALQGRPVTLVPNPDPDSEMLSSVRCGIAALPGECSAAVIALGDQPSITPAIVNELIERFIPASHGIVVPFHAGHRGHPMIVSTHYRDEIINEHDASGLRGLLEAHADDVLKVGSEGSVLEDMDDPEDYQQALRRLEASSTRTPNGDATECYK